MGALMDTLDGSRSGLIPRKIQGMTQISTPLYEKLLASSANRGEGPPARASASVVLWRRGGSGGREDGLEVYWVRRSPAMRFMGGWHAFPGGGLSRSDAGIPISGLPGGLTKTTFTEPSPGLDEEQKNALGVDLVPGLSVCVARELFEELGLLLTESAVATSAEQLRHARQQLLAKEVKFAELVERESWRLSADALTFAGRWMTPPLAPMRFDNRFFLLHWPADKAVQPVLEGGEHDIGEWIDPSVALGQWQAGEVITSPPILHLLKVLAEDGPEAGLIRLRDPRETNLGPLRRIEFRPGVVLLPLPTPTLLPATHTNAFLLGREEVVLIDPASRFPAQIERLQQAVKAAGEQGRRVSAIWLTHHHPDHVGAVNEMRQMLDVPVLAHPATAERLRPVGIPVDGELHDGQRVVLAGSPPFPVRVIHTPGHAQGHLSFYDETYGSLLIGDLIAGIGTIVIDPPEGDMDDYLKSLESMMELAPKTIFPSHGPVVLNTVEKLCEYRDHRLLREERVMKSWQAGLRTTGEIVKKVYSDVPLQVHPVAERQIEAHLVRLRKLGCI